MTPRRTRSNWISEVWNAWYEFHRRIDQNGPRSRLTSEQHTELANLVAARNDTRAGLIWKTKQLELRQVTIRIAPDRKRPGNELDLAAKIRRDLYAHGPIEIDPDRRSSPLAVIRTAGHRFRLSQPTIGLSTRSLIASAIVIKLN